MVFKKYYNDLSEGLSPGDITTDLFSKGVISPSDLDEIQVVKQTNKEKADLLLRAVKRIIQIDHTRFFIFLKSLNKRRKYTPLVKKMMDDMNNGETYILD